MFNGVVDGIRGPRIGLHVCRGNWSRREEVLLTGDYEKLLPAFEAMRPRQFVLEYATPRAGDIVSPNHTSHLPRRASGLEEEGQSR